MDTAANIIMVNEYPFRWVLPLKPTAKAAKNVIIYGPD
jgi:hypothetical protein